MRSNNGGEGKLLFQLICGQNEPITSFKVIGSENRRRKSVPDFTNRAHIRINTRVKSECQELDRE